MGHRTLLKEKVFFNEVLAPDILVVNADGGAYNLELEDILPGPIPCPEPYEDYFYGLK